MSGKRFEYQIVLVPLAERGQNVVSFNVSSHRRLTQGFFENCIADKNINVAKPSQNQKEDDDMPYLIRGGYVGKNKDQYGRYKGYYTDRQLSKNKEGRIYVYGTTRKECGEKVNAGTLERDERIKNGHEMPYKNMRVHELLDEFITYMEGNKNEAGEIVNPKCTIGQLKVHKNNVRHLKKHVRNAQLKGKDILTPIEIEKAIAKITSSRTGTLSTKIQKEAYVTFNMAMKYGKKKGLVATNVMEDVDKTTHESEHRLAFTEQVQKDILQYAKANSKLYFHFLFGFNTACRPFEYCKVKKCHINYDFKQVYIDGTKTRNSKRTMKIFDPLFELQDYLTGFDNDDYVFTASNDALNDELRRILKAIGVAEPKDYSLDCLRHTLQTRLNEQGIDTATISKWVGNSPTIALKHYIQVLPEHEQRQAEKFNAQIANF